MLTGRADYSPFQPETLHQINRTRKAVDTLHHKREEHKTGMSEHVTGTLLHQSGVCRNSPAGMCRLQQWLVGQARGLQVGWGVLHSASWTA